MFSILQVETTSVCNSHCIFCPHDRMEHVGTMSDELYRKILTEAKSLPLETFVPMMTGEPFCDEKIIARVKMARNYMPNVLISLYTNGSLIGNGNIENLATIEGLHIIVSLNAACPDTRERLMGLRDYWQVADSIKKMTESGITVIPVMVDHPSICAGEVSEFKRIWGLANKYQNFAGEVYEARGQRNMSCLRAMHHMTVMWDGRANLCCYDPFGKVVFGNVNQESMVQIWNSEERQAYVEAHERCEGERMTLCQQCTDPQV